MNQGCTSFPATAQAGRLSPEPSHPREKASMLLESIFDRFVQESPASVMVRGLLENVLQPGPLDELFDRTAVNQYSDRLLFSNVVEVMGLVVTGFYDSPHAVYVAHPELFPVTLKCFYEKLQGIEPPVMQAMVRDSAARLRAISDELNADLPPLLPGYRVKILDGNALAGSEHRIKELRSLAAGALPGKSLGVLDPQSGLVIDVFPCEDGHAQERSLLAEVLGTVQAGDLWIEDRNFCTLGFICGVAARGAAILVREHQGLPWTAVSDLKYVGRTATGEVWEQEVDIAVESAEDQRRLGTKRLKLRRLVVKLDKPTRDNEAEVVLLTNVVGKDALVLADLYLDRWRIETVFQVLTVTLDCEQSRLGYPRAALFGFCVTVVAYNLLAVVKAALRSVHGVEAVEKKVSVHHLTGDVRRTHAGMMIAIPCPHWLIFREADAREMADWLRGLAARVKLSRYKKAPTRAKKPPTPRQYDPQHPHVSTAKILAKRDRK
jgi:IS4 transposase